MKLKIFLLSLMCFLVVINTSRVGSKQLFDLVNKDIENKVKNSENVQKGSLFEKFGNIESPKPENKNLFETLNFSQIHENLTEKKSEANSLFSKLTNENKDDKKINKPNKPLIKVGSSPNKPSTANVAKHPSLPKNPSPVNGKKNQQIKKNTPSKTNAPLVKVGSSKKSNNKSSNGELVKNQKQSKNSKTDKTEKTIKSLKKKVNNLLQMNEKLMKHVKLQSNINNNRGEFKEHVINFIQKYDQDVNSLKKNIESSRNLVEHKIVKKNEEFKKLYEKTTQNFDDIQLQIKDLNDKVVQIETEEEKKIKNIQTNFSLKDLKVKNRLNVDGIAFINKVNAKSIDLGNIKLDSNQITFLDENSKIVIGNEVTSIGSIVKNMGALNRLINKCGENFEKCKPISEDLIREQTSKQEEILENLKKLRGETTQVLNRHRKLR